MCWIFFIKNYHYNTRFRSILHFPLSCSVQRQLTSAEHLDQAPLLSDSWVVRPFWGRSSRSQDRGKAVSCDFPMFVGYVPMFSGYVSTKSYRSCLVALPQSSLLLPVTTFYCHIGQGTATAPGLLQQLLSVSRSPVQKDVAPSLNSLPLPLWVWPIYKKKSKWKQEEVRFYPENTQNFGSFKTAKRTRTRSQPMVFSATGHSGPIVQEHQVFQDKSEIQIFTWHLQFLNTGWNIS